jgi:predicted RNase H-like nuclease
VLEITFVVVIYVSAENKLTKILSDRQQHTYFVKTRQAMYYKRNISTLLVATVCREKAVSFEYYESVSVLLP